LKQRISAIVLLLTLAYAAPAKAAEQSAETLAPGLKHHVLSRGEAATTKSYRILLGAFDRQSDADQMLERLREQGFTAFPFTGGTDYLVVTPSLPHRQEAEDLRKRLIDRGFSPALEIQEIQQDLTHTEGPWKIHVLEADPQRVAIQVAHAHDAAIGLETTAALAERRHALAAINGGYFRMEGPLAGDSRGVLQIKGRLLSEPDRGRAAVGFYDQDGLVRSVFGRLGFRGEVYLGGRERIPLDGINRHREPSEIILYTPEFHRTTLTSSDGAEIVIENGHIVEVSGAAGSSVIPSDGMVLSIGSERVPEVLPRMRHGDSVFMKADLLPLLPDPQGEWEKTEYIVGGGPLLLWKGQRLEKPEEESISRVFFLARHPRTAVGVRADGTLLFVTVDGRRPEESVGMSLPELTDLMLELGSVSAINLDGGGSTTMVVEGNVVNRPSGGSARRNADAILLFSRTKKGG
jgi:exopolysaccharide biosynthesis protein